MVTTQPVPQLHDKNTIFTTKLKRSRTDAAYNATALILLYIAFTVSQTFHQLSRETTKLDIKDAGD